VHPLASKVSYHRLNDSLAEIVLNDWECDLSIRLSIDEATGDIVLEPSAWTMQKGIAGIGLIVANVDKMTRCQQRPPSQNPQAV
jgi:hypothetical protein